MSKNLRILISAVEPSGDRLAAKLIQALQNYATVEALGITGPCMRAVGVQTLGEMKTISAMGITEVLSKLPALYAAKKQLLQTMNTPIDCYIGVDAPDFHLPILAKAKRKGIPAIGYVSPQIWAWRPNRAKKIATQVDTLLCLFDFEPPLYPKTCNAVWVGHPIIEDIPSRSKPIPYRFGLLPGSREQEIRKHIPLFVDTAKHIHDQHPKAQFILSCPQHLTLPTLPRFIEVSADGVQAMHDVQAALTKSGTVTLELALMEVPMVVAHVVNRLTYAIGKKLVTGINHLALPNILSQREVVPEFIQNPTPMALASGLLNVSRQSIDLTSIQRDRPIEHAARAVLQTLVGKK